ncbi:hypothetical protein [Clostridium thermosuccinogenes]|uniref:hypothetical protein n=1 Tax=Clostridium thermosuccinogenes TaxID=84032 RepID=UPI000CA29EA9|nr:hypothetical protein [Pseudoclostridium thermosuccinogenes]AUS95600.1 hypothetical protein CDO33_03565 [Pseudoclostridium thermosuccinogenes]
MIKEELAGLMNAYSNNNFAFSHCRRAGNGFLLFCFEDTGLSIFCFAVLLTQILKYAAESFFVVNNCFALNL